MSADKPSSARAGRTGYLPTLDGWRAIAIGLVICAHTIAWPHALRHFAALNYFGDLGVDVFFAISGLLICSRLLEEERTCGAISMRGFYIRRVFRILPPALLYLLVVAVLSGCALIPKDWPGWWAALLFYRNYYDALVNDPGVRGYLAGHFWSLSIEEHFYLLLPAILVFLPRWRRQLLLLLTILGFAWIAGYVHLVPDALRSADWSRRTDLRLASLLFPAWLMLELARPHVRAWFVRWLHPAVAAGIMLLCGAGYAAYHYHKAHLLAASQVGSASAAPVLHAPATPANFVVPLIFPLLILATMLHPRSWVSRFLEWKPLRFIGRLSYSIYLWQQLFWLCNFHPGGRGQAMGLLCTFVVACLSFYLIERPFIRLGHRLAPPSTPGHRDVATTA